MHLVGLGGFEPPTSWSRTRRNTSIPQPEEILGRREGRRGLPLPILSRMRPGSSPDPIVIIALKNHLQVFQRISLP